MWLVNWNYSFYITKANQIKCSILSLQSKKSSFHLLITQNQAFSDLFFYSIFLSAIFSRMNEFIPDYNSETNGKSGKRYLGLLTVTLFTSQNETDILLAEEILSMKSRPSVRLVFQLQCGSFALWLHFCFLLFASRSFTFVWVALVTLSNWQSLFIIVSIGYLG